MKKEKKNYDVNIDMKWSMDYTVKANSMAEAKKIAWERFKNNPPKSCFEILADRDRGEG
jgi:hypothetical protein